MAQRSSVERPDGTKRCRRCRKWLLKEASFARYEDARYLEGFRYISDCHACRPIARREYHQTHKQEAKAAHNNWRARSLDADPEQAVEWYFKRKLSAYRRTNKVLGLAFDLDVEYLMRLFRSQEGRCYYTGLEMTWNNFGKGKGNISPQSLTVDRLTPRQGYTRGNIVLCTMRANEIKGSRTREEFLDLCRAVFAYRRLGSGS